MINFSEWLTHLNEIKLQDLEKENGWDMNSEKLLAMYVLYFQAYSAEGLKPWNYSMWLHSRGENWTFIGVLPKPEDVQKCKDAIVKNSDIQAAADEISSGPDKDMMSYAGGISYRITHDNGVKITSSFGKNAVAKMRGAAEVIKMANEADPPMNIFTAADERLRDLIKTAEENMPRYHQKGLVPVSSLGLSTPPKSVVPLLFQTIKNMPGASGLGTWTGYEPDTGALKMDLRGAGEVKKFIFGNKSLWQNAIKGLLQRSGHYDKFVSAKKIIDQGGLLGLGAKITLLAAVNSALGGMTGGAKIDQEGLMWILSNLED